MFQRHFLPSLIAPAATVPVITITGPRQFGKTMLSRQAFPDKSYVNLERPNSREFARPDPRAFLAKFALGAVIVERRYPETYDSSRYPAAPSGYIPAANQVNDQ